MLAASCEIVPAVVFVIAMPTPFEKDGQHSPDITDTGATLVDIDTELETCGVLILLVDHDVFRVVPAEERGAAVVRLAS